MSSRDIKDGNAFGVATRDGAIAAQGWAAIEDIRPTQITVGFREVADKRRRRREALAAGRADFPRAPVPLVLGPGAHPFALDRHHWLRALYEDGARATRVRVVEDLSALDEAAFWRTLDRRGWCHPFGADGRRRGYDAIPRSVADLVDDPLRSLASALRRRGGFRKDETPFSEFRWVDQLRQHIDPGSVTSDFDEALTLALELSLSVGAHDGPQRVSAGHGASARRFADRSP